MTYIVCGWHTPDYDPWLGPLRESLDRVGAPHDFVRVEKLAGGWERNTLRKPAMIIQAMRRHPSTTVIFLDVDALVHGPLDELADISTDIGLHMRMGLDRLGKPRLGMRTGTMVVSPTDSTKIFLHRWAEISNEARRGMVDQNTLVMALARTPELSITNLSVAFCATAADGIQNPIIAHDRASAAATWSSRWARQVRRISGMW
jgi:hypothetical protein